MIAATLRRPHGRLFIPRETLNSRHPGRRHTLAGCHFGTGEFTAGSGSGCVYSCQAFRRLLSILSSLFDCIELLRHCVETSVTTMEKVLCIIVFVATVEGFTGAPDSGTYSTGGITGPTYFVGSTGFTGPKGSMGATGQRGFTRVPRDRLALRAPLAGVVTVGSTGRKGPRGQLGGLRALRVPSKRCWTDRCNNIASEPEDRGKGLDHVTKAPELRGYTHYTKPKMSEQQHQKEKTKESKDNNNEQSNGIVGQTGRNGTVGPEGKAGPTGKDCPSDGPLAFIKPLWEFGLTIWFVVLSSFVLSHRQGLKKLKRNTYVA
ncbi:hypothetical protein LSAT2_009368 [Lamellibrachia satsuma]|nr:hypothetical protein LSAT2_009368 [Lamellibrachia satsuma]